MLGTLYLVNVHGQTACDLLPAAPRNRVLQDLKDNIENNHKRQDKMNAILIFTDQPILPLSPALTLHLDTA